MNHALDRDQLDRTLHQLREAVLTRKDVDTILRALAARWGVDAIALDESNSAELAVDGEIPLYLIHLAHLPGLVAAIPMPQGVADSPRALAELLRANLSWQLTQGGTFGMAPGLDQPMLCRLVLLAGMDAAALDHELASFADFAKAWREDLVGRVGESASPPIAPVPGMRV